MADIQIQARGIVESLAKDKIKVSEDKQIVALIAYLQRLGIDIKGQTK
jgi:cytochrome c oxidase cbb3-type subunit I/II